MRFVIACFLQSKTNQSQPFYYSYYNGGPSKCDCSKTGTCLKKKVCNCVANQKKWLHDDITITSMADLPLTKVAFGDVNDSREKGKVRVGDLVCM